MHLSLQPQKRYVCGPRDYRRRPDAQACGALGGKIDPNNDVPWHFFQQFTGPMTAWWKTLGLPLLTPEVQKKLIDSVHDEVGSRGIEELEAERDGILLGLLGLRTSART
jgi:hypothetical protein